MNLSGLATGRLAEFIIGWTDRGLPAATVGAVKNCLIDLFGAAAAGFHSPAATAVRRTAGIMFPPGRTTVWFSPDRLGSIASAWANSAAASAMDLDDGHRGAAGHPGASIIPACLAAAEEVEATGAELIAAVAVGYEVACRVASARPNQELLPSMSTGRWCAYGAAAGVGLLRRLEPPVLAQALSVAGVQSPDMAAARYSGIMGNGVKEGIPWATLTGLTAVELALRGLTGPLDILDHPDYYRSEEIVANLGQTWAVEQVYYKPYACCRWIHPALDAVLDILADEKLPPENIVRIEVDTFERTLTLNNYADPADLESAQYSLPFCLAAVVRAGKDSLLPLRERLLSRADIVDLARRVEVRADPVMTAGFPAQTAARVRVICKDRELTRQVDFPYGDPANPLSEERIRLKFNQLTENILPVEAGQRLLAGVDELERLSARELVVRMRPPSEKRPRALDGPLQP